MQLRQIFVYLTDAELEGLQSYLANARRLLATGINQPTEIKRMIESEEYRQICHIEHAAFLELGQRELQKRKEEMQNS